MSPKAVKVIKNLYKALLLTHMRLEDVVYASKDQYEDGQMMILNNSLNIIPGFVN